MPQTWRHVLPAELCAAQHRAALVCSFGFIFQFVCQGVLDNLAGKEGDFCCPITKRGTETVLSGNSILKWIEVSDTAVFKVSFVHSTDDCVKRGVTVCSFSDFRTNG
jgi:hypothetical protein